MSTRWNRSRRDFLRMAGSVSLAVVLGSGLASNRRAGGENRPPNVILFLADDLGWTDLGCYGSLYYETPNIDRLAEEGMRFTDAYSSCTVCSPTRASILTGKYPARVRITDWIPGHNRPFARLRVPEFHYQLPLEEITIAEALHSAGYISASMGKWHLGGDPFYPDKQGFDLNIAGDHRGQPPSYFSPHRIPILKDGPEGESLSERLAREAVKFIEDNRERPFFLYLPFYEVHTPLQAREETTEYYEKKEKHGNHKNPTYAAMIHRMDEAVGKVLAKVDGLGLAGNTLVLFTSDNGGLIPVTGNEPLRVGKGSAYEGGVRVPLIARWPGAIKAGRVCHEPAISVDFFPTILEAAGLVPESGHILDGQSLLPLFTHSDAALYRDALYWHYPHYHPGGARPYGAIRRRDWKLIEFFEDGKLELYNLKDDIGESNDLSSEMPDIVIKLRELLHRWRDSVNAQMPYANPEYDPRK